MVLGTWLPWEFFLMLDYFSRVYLVGVLFMMIWGYSTSFRILLGARSSRRAGSFAQDAYLRLVNKNSNLNSIHSLSVIFTSGCCVNQIFGVWFTYMDRATDANPFSALHQAWIVMQILISLHVSFYAVRLYAVAALERSRTNLSALSGV
jgi:hypothetical protein